MKQRVAEAQEDAEELVRSEREAAEADAEDQRREVANEVENEIAAVEADAEASQRRAEDLVEDAAQALIEARQLADEAADAARAAAVEASQEAQQLKDEAKRRASDAAARVGASSSCVAKHPQLRDKGCAHSNGRGRQSRCLQEARAGRTGCSATRATRSPAVSVRTETRF